ncbi:MAG: hypothetical protein Q9225_002866 [Loekoesia sp. 1 TL-2023]
MVLRRAYILKGLGKPRENHLPTYAIGKPVSASGKSHWFSTPNLREQRYVPKCPQACTLWSHGYHSGQFTGGCSKHHSEEEEKLDSSTPESPLTGRSAVQEKNESMQGMQSSPVLLRSRQDESSENRLTDGSQPPFVTVSQGQEAADLQGLNRAPLIYISGRRRWRIRTARSTPSAARVSESCKLLTERVNRKPSFNFTSLALWKQSNRRGNTRSRLEDFSPQIWRWTRQFARIYDGQDGHTSYPPLRGPLGSRLLGKDKDQIFQLWKKLSSKRSLPRRQFLWQSVMLWTLRHDHDKALTFLNATVLDSKHRSGATRYAIEDALKFLVSTHLEGQAADIETTNDLHQLFCSFATAADPRDSYTRPISQKIVYLLLRHSDSHQTQTLYETLVNSRLNVASQSLTHFMYKFARMGKLDLAMDALKRAAACGADVSSDNVQYFCIKLLRTRFDEAELYRLRSYLATEMLELGIRPGIPMLNTMILNAVEASDYQTAYAMFETARNHGIRRDTITYSILLKIARQSVDERLIKTIMQMAEEDGALPRNNQLVFCLVITILQIALAKKAGVTACASKYRGMLQVYARYCDISPLQVLGIHLDVHRDVKSTGPVSQPSPQLLSVMILGYIRLFGQDYQIKELYHRYQRFIAQNHHLVAPTAETEHLANAFLFCLGRNKTTFTMCPIILKNMLEPPASTTLNVAKPTVQTWSIVLRSYFFNDQRAAGENILKMMRERGIQPNQVTMNTIISGYARMQDASAAVNAVQQMEESGFEVDSYTFKGLTRITNREQLLDALRKVAEKPTETEVVQSTERSTQTDHGTSVDDRILRNPDEGLVQAGRAFESSQSLLQGEAVQQSEQDTTDVASPELCNDPNLAGGLQQKTIQEDQDRQKKGLNQSTKRASRFFSDEGDDLSYLYQIHDTPPEAV